MSFDLSGLIFPINQRTYQADFLSQKGRNQVRTGAIMTFQCATPRCATLNLCVDNEHFVFEDVSSRSNLFTPYQVWRFGTSPEQPSSRPQVFHPACLVARVAL